MCDKACEYFKRSFFSVDGLWFMMVEKALSFDKALDIDEKVWKVMPKIQSKKLKELYGIRGNTLQDLVAALKIKFELEGYRTSIDNVGADQVEMRILDCPWLDIMKKSDRPHLAAKVGERICHVEFQGWADSFDKGIRFSLNSQLCRGEEACCLQFQLKR